MVIKRDELAKVIRPHIAQIGELPGGYARLGRGDKSGVIVKDAKLRLVFYYNIGQPTAWAPLALNMNLAAINNPAYEGYRVRLGYPNYRPDVLHVMGIDAVEGVAAGAGFTPDEQYNSRAQYPDVDSINNLRLAPNNPADSNVYVGPGYYYDADGNLQFFGGDLLDLQGALDLLTGSGQHQIAVVSLDASTGELTYVTNTAVDGGGDDKAAFNQADVVALTYGDADQQKGVVHLYDGQTVIQESDIYREIAPRVLFTRPLPATGGGAGVDLIARKRSWFGV